MMTLPLLLSSSLLLPLLLLLLPLLLSLSSLALSLAPVPTPPVLRPALLPSFAPSLLAVFSSLLDGGGGGGESGTRSSVCGSLLTVASLMIVHSFTFFTLAALSLSSLFCLDFSFGLLSAVTGF
eukprot:TRINITY_DN603_c2_g1_i2.p4 TRINITY_DN603_c2_g1~~TRINITY_DN603_c2_g1_i2.p4  ORF type:complete len:124 (-),score=39.27 TRINITY_DN603_c2_g1_i2:73-444(-)